MIFCCKRGLSDFTQRMSVKLGRNINFIIICRKRIFRANVLYQRCSVIIIIYTIHKISILCFYSIRMKLTAFCIICKR